MGKKFRSFLALSLLMLGCNAKKVDALETTSNNDKVTFVNNSNFNVNDSLITSTNNSSGTYVLISNDKAKLTDTLVIEAKLSISNTNEGGFVFGVSDNKNVLENGYYELTYNSSYFIHRNTPF